MELYLQSKHYAIGNFIACQVGRDHLLFDDLGLHSMDGYLLLCISIMLLLFFSSNQISSMKMVHEKTINIWSETITRRIIRGIALYILHIAYVYHIWPFWSYSPENGPLRSNTSYSIYIHGTMWGVNDAIFGIIRNATSHTILRWNLTILWQANFVPRHFK